MWYHAVLIIYCEQFSKFYSVFYVRVAARVVILKMGIVNRGNSCSYRRLYLARGFHTCIDTRTFSASL
jgi:hypothetical protein